MINLSLNDGYEIRDEINKYRKKNNLKEPDIIKNAYNKNTIFLEEELSYVTSLRITATIIDYIDYFPNISKLTFDSTGSISNEVIQKIIDKYPNLKELKINNQDSIRILDVSNLKNLEVLEITSNKNLKKINGIDKLSNLYRLSFYDNIVYSDISIQELMKIVCDQSYNKGTECNVDVLYILDLMNYLSDNNLSFDSISSNLCFVEHLKSGIEMDQEYLKYSAKELFVAYEKAKEIISSYIKETDSDMEKFAIIYHWMCKNIKYDSKALDDKSKTHSENGIAKGRKYGTNGTINALLYGSCICQGYTKTMQLLLRMIGISSFDTGCIIENNNITHYVLDDKKHASDSDHSILKVNLGGRIYYSDVTWDSSRYRNGINRIYFLLSKKDMSLNHQLVGEDDVIDVGESISKDEFDKLMVFAEARIKEVELIKKIENILNIKFDGKINSVRYKYINQKLEELFHSGDISIKDYLELKKFILYLYNKQEEINNRAREDKEAEVIANWEEVKRKYNYDNLSNEERELIENEYRYMLYQRRMREINQDENLFENEEEIIDDVENIESHHRLI